LILLHLIILPCLQQCHKSCVCNPRGICYAHSAWMVYKFVIRSPGLKASMWLQLAPYCTQYERLAAHLESAGVAVEPNLWDQPVSLAREHRHLAPDSPKGPDARADGSLAPAGPRLTAQLLPAHKLLPFMVPFRGGPGSLCGGAATLSSKFVP